MVTINMCTENFVKFGHAVFGRPFVKRFALCYRTVVCLSCLSVTLVYCGQKVGWIKMKLGKEVRLGPGHIVLDGDPAHRLPKGHSPQFSTHVCCGQTAGWIKMPLGREVGLGPGHVVLDEDPCSFPRKDAQPPHTIFGPCLLWPNGRPSQLVLCTCSDMRADRQTVTDAKIAILHSPSWCEIIIIITSAQSI